MTDNQPAINDEQIRNAKLVWDYHQNGSDLRPDDVAIGSHDLDVAVLSAELYRAGLFPTLVFTSGNGHYREGLPSRRRRSLPRARSHSRSARQRDPGGTGRRQHGAEHPPPTSSAPCPSSLAATRSRTPSSSCAFAAERRDGRVAPTATGDTAVW